MNKYSFKKGYNQVPVSKSKEIKKLIMSALNISTTPSWSARLKGDIEPKISEYNAIEKIFREIGITDIWGK
ncbi:MAG: hypothetical protein RR183_07120 [Bacteroidales bacterium]